MTLAGHDPGTEVREPIHEVGHAQVRLTGGPLAEQYEATHAYYLAIPNDRMLKVYRERAGLPAPGDDMGGWYDFEGFTPGAFIGNFMAGLARFGAGTGDTATHEKVAELLDGFAATLGPDNVSILRPETNQWVCYTLDKHWMGMLGAYQLSGLERAKDVMERILAGSEHLLPAEGRDRVEKLNLPYDETYIMSENLFTLAEITGNARFHDLAIRYLLDREFFDPLAEGRDPLPKQHAYSHTIALSSGGMAWLKLGDPKYKRALEHAFDLLTAQMYASGAWGPQEQFVTQGRGELFDSLAITKDHYETPCGAWAATKLARYLIRMTAAPDHTRYVDYLERSIFNTILAVRRPDTEGDFPYYSNYGPLATKAYYHLKWPCCSGTLVQTVADYPLDLWFESADGVHSAVYAPSRASFEHLGSPFTILTETDYPADDTLVFTIEAPKPVEFTLHLRIPGWLERPAAILVNGAPAAVPASPGTFAAIRRTWRAGDRVELTLPQTFRTEAIDTEHRDVVALMRGSVEYVALSPAEDLLAAPFALPDGLRRIGPQAFVAEDGGRRLVFVPLHSIQTETYQAYLRTTHAARTAGERA
jgi:uncharacterized protein